MYYSPEKMALGDFWFAKEGDVYHMFNLMYEYGADDFSKNPLHQTIGHAISKDLFIWTEKPIVLYRGEAGTWDDLSLWTGSIIKKGDTWYMFYTGRSTLENGGVQRIGYAVSKDLYTWEKNPGNPVIDAHPKWYEADISDSKTGSISWRDPFIFYNETDKYYYALIAASLNQGKWNRRGCVAQARSRDLSNWEVLPPLYSPEKYFHCEVPQIFKVGDLWYLTFCTFSGYGTGVKGIFSNPSVKGGNIYAAAESPLGRYKELSGNVLFGMNSPLGYAGRIVDFEGKTLLTYWQHEFIEGIDTGRRHLGKLALPKEMRQNIDGTLSALYYDEIEKYSTGELINSSKLSLKQDKYGEWSIKDNKISVDATDSESIAILDQMPAERDFIYEVSVKITGKGTGGIVIRCSSESPYNKGYAVYLDNFKGTVECDHLNRYQGKESLNMDIESGCTHKLKVVSVSDFIEIYVDGKFQFAAPGYDYKSGLFGLFAGDGMVEFSDISAKPLEWKSL